MKKNTNISERISKLIEALGVNANAFANKLGYARSQAVYDLISGKANPSFDFFSKLLNSEYSETISVEWLISGRGQMLKNKTLLDNPDDILVSCEKCKLKDHLINSLRDQISVQQKLIDYLEEHSLDKGGQKRKASA